ncbi:RNase A-like domain-containing protein [Pseudomonas orientalis]|uniref:RNase A-like domain-containing protein n=1 Tax=Pseudomonas orientalis TaxID=76758 RepID=UPI001F155B4E|nr:RNase A-like domain-containing protein [Pseudomonas orientalis]
MATEFAVPLSTASLYSAFRVSSVRAGRISIITSEKPLQASKKLGGGHTIFKHVGKDISYLTARFASKKVHVSSTFYDLEMAEWAVSQALQRNKLKVLMYSKARFVLRYEQYSFDTQLEKAIGWGVTRQDQSKIITMSKLTVTIKYAEYNRMPYYIVTAFPAL